MHHASEAHEFDKPPSHAFALPREGTSTDLLRKAFPEAYFNDEYQEWRIDWDPKQFPDQGRRIEAFSVEYGFEVLHRY